MINEASFIDLNKNYKTYGLCFIKIFNLLLAPMLMYSIVVFGYLGIIPFDVEVHSVILIGLIFLIYLWLFRHNAYYASCKFRKKFELLKSKLAYYINRNILIIDNISKAKASIDDFLHEFTLPLRNTNFASVAFGIFPTLGILGTFISIAIAMPDFSSNSTAELEKEISTLLGGVGTAFYVSIYGIFLSIWWIFFEKIGISRFEKDVLIIKDNTKDFFWNKMDIEKIHFQKSFANYEILNKVFLTMNSDNIIDKINASINTKMNLLEDVINMEKETVVKTHIYLQEREQEQKNFARVYKTMISDMKILSENIYDITLSLSKITKNTITNEYSTNQITNKLSNNVETLNKSLEQISATNIKIIYEDIVSTMRSVQEDSRDIETRLKNNIYNFDRDITDKLTNSLELIDNETISIIEKLKNIK
jgi:hypothetical protein